jgi:hypothetical protein
LSFEKAGGSTTTLEFTAGEPVDLLDYTNGEALRMFTDEQVPDGTYTGVRLLLDQEAEATVVDVAGGEFPVALEEGAYAKVDFTVTEDERSFHSLTLTLDLRQSLAFDDAGDGYTLAPVVRAVKTDKSANVAGRVTFACASGESLARNGAVYLFAGHDVEPDDLDGTAAEPYATARVTIDTATDEVRFALRSLEPGDYTIALTCRGDEEDLGEDDGIAFHGVRNVNLDADETLDVELG